MAEPTLLSVRDLRVIYPASAGSVVAVDGVSFDLAAGEILGLAGESGSGKSTIAQAILRILPPGAEVAAGSIRFAGRDVLALSELALRSFRWAKVSLVFQSAMNALNPVITIGEQIADAIVAHEAVTWRQALARAAALLELVGMQPELLRSYPHQLSGGMRQRVVVAIALALRPQLVMMDEPTTALDVVVQREILQRIVKLQKERGFALLFITHDLALLGELADRIAVMLDGRIVEIGPTDELLRAPRHAHTRCLVADLPALPTIAEAR